MRCVRVENHDGLNVLLIIANNIPTYMQRKKLRGAMRQVVEPTYGLNVAGRWPSSMSYNYIEHEKETSDAGDALRQTECLWRMAKLDELHTLIENE